MPRPFIFNLQDLLKFARSKEVQVESHSTLELITTATDTNERIFRLATAKLVIDGVTYKGALKDAGSIKQSITRTVNRTEVAITNLSSLVDGDVAPFIPVPPRGQPIENLRLLLGADFINKPNEIQGAKVKIGRYWKNLDTGQEHHEILFRGVVQANQADQDAVRLSILSDINAASIGGGRRVARKCQWKFRDPTTCTYASIELACNRIFTSAGGCSGRTNEHHFGGFIFIQPKSSVSGPAAVSAPPNNQTIKSYNGSSYSSQQQQPFFAFHNATFTNDTTNEVTRIYPGILAEDTVIEGPSPSLELRDTDAADYIFELNAGVFSQRFVGGGTLIAITQSSSTITFQSGSVFNPAGKIVGIAKTIHTSTTPTGNITTGLDSLHSFNLPANSLANNLDQLDVVYAGTFATNDNDKRIVISFGGQVYADTGARDQDAGEWVVSVSILRISATTVRVATMLGFGSIVVSGASVLTGNGLDVSGVSTLTVSDLAANAMTMLVQGEATATDDIVQNLSSIKLTQNT